MRAIAAGADNASELGRRLSVSKQAAAKTVAVLEERGYVARDAIRSTPVANAFRSRRSASKSCEQAKPSSTNCATMEAEDRPAQLERLESDLAALVGASPVRVDTPGWMTRDLGEPV